MYFIFLLLFVHFQLVDDRLYEEVKSMEDLYKIVEQYLDEYNQLHKAQMNLVIFRYIVQLNINNKKLSKTDTYRYIVCQSIRQLHCRSRR